MPNNGVKNLTAYYLNRLNGMLPLMVCIITATLSPLLSLAQVLIAASEIYRASLRACQQVQAEVEASVAEVAQVEVLAAVAAGAGNCKLTESLAIIITKLSVKPGM